MKDKLKEFIINFHSRELPAPYAREFSLPLLSPNINKVIVLIGMRRSGKTWCTYQIMREYLNQGVPKEQVIHINFEDDRLTGFAVSDFQLILDAYFELYPKTLESQTLYFFFDEIHEIENWEKFIRRLNEQTSYKIFITGSSAKMLSKEIATNLRGRTLTREVFPLSFREYLNYKNVKLDSAYSTKTLATIKHHLNRFLEQGGFPETLNMESDLHQELLQNYMDVVIYKDIVERHKITNIVALKQMQITCIKNSATKFSVSKIFRSLKSRGLSIGKNAVYDFLEYFEDAYAFFPISAYHFSHNKSQQSPKKIYPVDQGLITAYTLKPEFEQASRLETAVFLHLRRQSIHIYYYQTSKGTEVDFLMQDSKGSISLYQVTVDMKDYDTRERELSALKSAMIDLDLESSTIVTLDHEETIEVNEGIIYCVPVWKFLIT